MRKARKLDLDELESLLGSVVRDDAVWVRVSGAQLGGDALIGVLFGPLVALAALWRRRSYVMMVAGLNTYLIEESRFRRRPAKIVWESRRPSNWSFVQTGLVYSVRISGQELFVEARDAALAKRIVGMAAVDPN